MGSLEDNLKKTGANIERSMPRTAKLDRYHVNSADQCMFINLCQSVIIITLLARGQGARDICSVNVALSPCQ